ncbi:MAG TPA: hypothetical protein VE221_03810 [Sphingomicrobium sp.]|nr:hypothetical protein [Sphingomicrobium sp.]
MGIATIWLGANSGAWNLITRGTAILAIATLAGIAAGGFAGVRRGDDARAVSEMIELSIRSAKRWLLAIRLALYGCVVAAAFGLIGATIRTHLSNPPKMSPVIDLILLTVIALALSLFRYRAKVALAKFEYLQRTLAADTA